MSKQVPVLDQKALAYRRLLADPCNGPLVSAPALGPTSGLVVRQKYILTPQSLNSSTAGEFDFIAFIQPALGRVLLNTINKDGTPSPRLQTVDLETGILSSTICHAYRPVAACAKWIPFGPIGTRSGVVGLGYVADNVKMVTTMTTGSTDDYLPLCQKVTSNGGMGEPMEARWIPSGPEELEFRQRDVTYNADVGTLMVIGRNIDGTPASEFARGYLEVTVVWEWVPDYTSGITSTIQAGTRSSYNAILSTLGDLARFAVDNQYVRMFMGAAAMGTAPLLLGGRSVNMMNAPGLLTSG